MNFRHCDRIRTNRKCPSLHGHKIATMRIRRHSVAVWLASLGFSSAFQQLKNKKTSVAVKETKVSPLREVNTCLDVRRLFIARCRIVSICKLPTNTIDLGIEFDCL